MGGTESRCTVITQKLSVAVESTDGIEVLFAGSLKVSLCSWWQEATWLDGMWEPRRRSSGIMWCPLVV